jgi:hypothetical protein
VSLVVHGRVSVQFVVRDTARDRTRTVTLLPFLASGVVVGPFPWLALARKTSTDQSWRMESISSFTPPILFLLSTSHSQTLTMSSKTSFIVCSSILFFALTFTHLSTAPHLYNFYNRPPSSDDHPPPSTTRPPRHLALSLSPHSPKIHYPPPIHPSRRRPSTTSLSM